MRDCVRGGCPVQPAPVRLFSPGEFRQQWVGGVYKQGTGEDKRGRWEKEEEAISKALVRLSERDYLDPLGLIFLLPPGRCHVLLELQPLAEYHGGGGVFSGIRLKRR